jgi:hypothetical protein
MDESSQQRIRRRLAEYLTDPAAEHREVASRFGALPVYADMGGTLFITPSLQILTMRHDEGAMSEECSPEWRLAAPVAAVERFPELRQLLPTRPSGSLDCSVCAGTGRLLGARCGSCIGLGWPALHSDKVLQDDARDARA